MEAALLLKYAPALLTGFSMTVFTWLVGTLCGMALGFAIALALRYAPRWITFPLRAYIEVIRGTPFLVQVFLLYYGGPFLGLKLGSLSSGLLALSVYGSPYFAEIFRAGLQSVPKGQIEAARALGYAEPTIVRRIMIPMLMASTLPALINFAIIMTKETVILSVITVPELLYEVQTMSAETFAFVEATFALAVFFWLFVEAISRFGHMLERRVTFFLQK